MEEKKVENKEEMKERKKGRGIYAAFHYSYYILSKRSDKWQISPFCVMKNITRMRENKSLDFRSVFMNDINVIYVSKPDFEMRGWMKMSVPYWLLNIY